jgi:hypothetical protein
MRGNKRSKEGSWSPCIVGATLAVALDPLRCASYVRERHLILATKRHMLQKGQSNDSQIQGLTFTYYNSLVTRKTLEKSCIYFYARARVTCIFLTLWITMWTNVLIVDNFHQSVSSNILNAATKWYH